MVLPRRHDPNRPRLIPVLLLCLFLIFWQKLRFDEVQKRVLLESKPRTTGNRTKEVEGDEGDGDDVESDTVAGETFSCQHDSDGAWAIGVFVGDTPLNLHPLEFFGSGNKSSSEKSVAYTNPVLTCANVNDPPSNFVADPFLAISSNHPNLVYMFFETKTNTAGKGEIGVAESFDMGITWRYVGIALIEPWHLSYPLVFDWHGDFYMLPECSQSGTLRLYKAIAFPLRWELVDAIIAKPIIDPTIVQWMDQWYLFVQDPSRDNYTRDGDLDIYIAVSPFGPWIAHPLNPVMSGDPGAGARSAGRIIAHGGALYRWGQNNGEAYGRDIMAFKIEELTPTGFRQTRVNFQAKRQVGNGPAAWDSVRRHHLDAVLLPDGTWLAAIDGDWQDDQ